MKTRAVRHHNKFTWLRLKEGSNKYYGGIYSACIFSATVLLLLKFSVSFCLLIKYSSNSKVTGQDSNFFEIFQCRVSLVITTIKHNEMCVLIICEKFTLSIIELSIKSQSSSLYFYYLKMIANLFYQIA